MKKFLLLLFCCWVGSVFGVGQDLCEVGLALGAELSKEYSGYQIGANSVAQMKYELELEKQDKWQQNQQLAPAQLENQATANAKTELVGKQLIEAERVRPKFDNDVDLDLLAKGQKISENAKEIIVESGKKSMVVNSTTEYVRKACKHSRSPEEFTCIRYLQNPTVEVTPAKYSSYWCSAGNHQPDDPRCRAKTYYYPPRMYKAKEVKISPELWVSECNALEERKDKKECKVIKTECLDNANRIINGEIITKPCWKYGYTYECKYPVAVSCTSLLQQGCELLTSECSHYVDGKCYIWEQQARCPVKTIIITKDADYTKAFCLEGDCFNTSSEQNNEMLSSITQLDIFAQMQKDIRAGVFNIFKGNELGCNKLCIGIKNCCKLSGWGLGLSIAGCSDQEKKLAEQRKSGLCHEVGTYCAERMPVVKTCIRKKTNFCCFSSKLTRLVQEQGRAQLGKGWGEAECPDCSGFTKEDLARLDFSRLDLSEVFVDFHATPQDLAKTQARLQERLKTFQADHTLQTKEQK